MSTATSPLRARTSSWIRALAGSSGILAMPMVFGSADHLNDGVIPVPCPETGRTLDDSYRDSRDVSATCLRLLVRRVFKQTLRLASQSALRYSMLLSRLARSVPTSRPTSCFAASGISASGQATTSVMMRVAWSSS